jgi:uncharacterized membrane protein
MENTNLPWWQVLSSWENIANKDNFISWLATFYIKSDFVVTNKRFIAHYPNIVLWFLPMWFNNITFNLKQISGVNINVEYKIFKILIWLLLTLVWIFSLMIFLIPVWIIFLSLWIQIYIKVATSWWITKCPIIFWEKQKAQELVNKLNSTIAENN